MFIVWKAYLLLTYLREKTTGSSLDGWDIITTISQDSLNVGIASIDSALSYYSIDEISTEKLFNVPALVVIEVLAPVMKILPPAALLVIVEVFPVIFTTPALLEIVVECPVTYAVPLLFVITNEAPVRNIFVPANTFSILCVPPLILNL